MPARVVTDSGWCNLTDGMVIGIGYVNVPGFIRRQAIRVVELRGAPGAVDASEGSSCAGKACHYSRRSNFTDRTIICVGHVNSGTAQRHAARIIETSYAPGAVGTAYTTPSLSQTLPAWSLHRRK